MEHRIERPLQPFGVGPLVRQVGDNERRPFGRRPLRRGGQIVKDDHFVPTCHQPFSDPPPDKAGSAGHHIPAHLSSPQSLANRLLLLDLATALGVLQLQTRSVEWGRNNSWSSLVSLTCPTELEDPFPDAVAVASIGVVVRILAQQIPSAIDPVESAGHTGHRAHEIVGRLQNEV